MSQASELIELVRWQQVDGWLARKYNMGSVLGSILDPAADKLLMTTMVVTLAMKSMLPREWTGRCSWLTPRFSD